MGKFLIFLTSTMIIALAGLLIWLVWNKVYIVIKRQQRAFDIEEAVYEKANNTIKEDKKE